MTKNEVIRFLIEHESDEDILEILSSVFPAFCSDDGTVHFDTGICVTDPDSFLNEAEDNLTRHCNGG